MTEFKSMRILVYGAGALGSVVGGFMARAGHRVTLVGREAHMAAIRDRGLRITGIWGDHCVTDIATRTGLDGLETGAFDLIVITTKTYNTTEAAEAVASLADADTLVCSYQNGLGNAEAVANAVGWERTVGARAIYGVVVTDPGACNVTVIANPTALGVFKPEAPADRVRTIAEAMDTAGLPTVFSGAIETVIWSKVTYNCALNPLSALLDVPYGAVAETEYTRGIVHDIVYEVYAVGHAMAVPLEPAKPADYLDLFYDKLLPPTGAHYASMHADFAHRHRTEIDSLNGAIMRYGQRLGISTPTNTLLTRLVHAREHALGVR